MSGGGDTTTVQKSDPWSGVQPFLSGTSSTQLKPGVAPIYSQGNGLPQYTTNRDGDQVANPAYKPGGQVINPSSDYQTVSTPGIYPESQNLYTQNGWSPAMQSLTNTYGTQLNGVNQSILDNTYQMSKDMFGGGYDPNVTSASPISGANGVTAQNVDPRAAFGSLGLANPTGSIGQMLSGQVNTAALDPVINNAMRRLGENYGDAVMPAIRNDAMAAGQYGGSRQGIAEGLASRGLGYAMGDMASNLYGNAYQQAQNNMYGTANNMAGLGLSNAQQNAGRDLSAQQINADNTLRTQEFNANLALQNNAQAMQDMTQRTQARTTALGLLGQAQNQFGNSYANQLNLLQAPNAYNWDNLNHYASIVQPGSGIGGTKSSSEPYYSNPLGTALGLGMGGLGLYNGLSTAGLLGGAGAAAAGSAGMDAAGEAAMLAMMA